MAYESLIGWRYLFRGKRSPMVWGALAVFVAIAFLGAYLFLASGSPSPTGVALLAFGVLGAICSGLLLVLSVISTVSVFGVVLGVAALLVVMGIATGFEAEFRGKVLGVNAHVLITKNGANFSNYRDVEEVASKLPHVVAIQPFTFEELLATRGKSQLSGVLMKGVDPERVGQVLDLPKHMIEGRADVLDPATADPPPQTLTDPPPVIIGRELARKLKAKVGDVLTLVSPLSGVDVKSWSANGSPPKTKKFRVGGIFYCGFDEYDRRLVYVNLKEAQDFAAQGDVVRGVELKVDHLENAHRVARLLDQKLGGEPYSVVDWRELNANLFTALTIQKIVLVLFMTLIVVVAAFNMVATLTMMVFDKTKEISIVKSMGATDAGVARIFQVVGLTIGALGTVVGLGLGLLLCYVLRRYAYPLDPKVYLIDKLPVSIHAAEVGIVGGITLLICFFSTLYPALKASSLRPVDGLRYE